MENFGIVLLVLLVFFIVTLLYWKLTKGLVEKNYGKKIWKHWGHKMYYWSGALFFSGGITVLLVYLFK